LSNARDTGPSKMTALQRRGRAIEAMLFLCIARFLIAAVPLRFWRRSLGQIVATNPDSDEDSQTPAERVVVQAVSAAVEQGARHLPIHLACLPRAMAAQWMLARRGCASRLVVAVAVGKVTEAHPLHAWVEAGRKIVVGDDPGVDYRPNLTLQSRR
jgi:hypothetical protein